MNTAKDYTDHQENIRLHGEVHRLQTANAELLEALRQCLSVLESYAGHPIVEAARAAIAKAEGGWHDTN